MPSGRRNIQEQLNQLLETSKNKSYFVGAVTVGFVILMVVLGILPSYTAFTAQGKQNGLRQNAVDQLAAKKATIEGLIKEQTQKQSLVDKFNTVFPNAPDQVAVLNEMDALSQKNQVVLVSGSFSEPRTNNDIIKKFKTNKQVKDQSLAMLYEGDRANLVSFVVDIESDVRVLDIVSISINRKVGKELEDSFPNRQFKLNIQVDYFYYDKTAQ